MLKCYKSSSLPTAGCVSSNRFVNNNSLFAISPRTWMPVLLVHLTVPSSEHVAAVNLSVGCHTPYVHPVTCPFVFFMSLMYMSPRAHSPRNRPSLHSTAQHQHVNMLPPFWPTPACCSRTMFMVALARLHTACCCTAALLWQLLVCCQHLSHCVRQHTTNTVTC